MPIYESDSDHHLAGSTHFSNRRRRSLHEALGGGRVADVLLWKHKGVSGGLLIGATAIWFLFEVAEYHFVPLLCHAMLATMITLFVWSNLGPLLQRDPPSMYNFQISEYTFRYVFAKTNRCLQVVYHISCGNDRKMFFAAIGFLWILSVIGNHVDSLNLIYFTFVCVETLPVLYERYEREIEYIAGRGRQDAKKLYYKLDSSVLNKIPRGPVKEKKFRK